MKLSKKRAAKLLSQMGFEQYAHASEEQLEAKIATLYETVPDTFAVGNEELDNLLDNILYEQSINNTVEVVADESPEVDNEQAQAVEASPEAPAESYEEDMSELADTPEEVAQEEKRTPAESTRKLSRRQQLYVLWKQGDGKIPAAELYKQTHETLGLKLTTVRTCVSSWKNGKNFPSLEGIE